MRSDDLPLSRAVVDRAAVERDEPDVLGRLRADVSTRVLLVGGGAVLAADHALALLTVDDAIAYADGVDEERWLLLGRDDERAYLALRVAAPTLAPTVGAASDVAVHSPVHSPVGRAPRQEVPEGTRWATLRTAGGALDARDAGLATAAVALDAWHERHPRCPRCGAATKVTAAGWTRVCAQDGSEHYPRTDPAVIMAVVGADDRLLLSHSAAWAPGRYSTSAGFVEAGESLEHAVRREVLEETGVLVGDVSYRASQPWPFPASLMVGFRAHALTTDVTVDGTEVTQARWFTRAELADAVGAGEIVPPGSTSIARALIEEWFGGPLPAAPDVTW
ncbi:NAD(+) diphosphatase [Cellulomonas composti]|uniref:NAD(+) diphosphatase n=1 Tax=Cellulomonas composti TaxID=266130 RepID=A0A511J9D4_9CELL|nr:NAD(+) diphosphatase [Cellulomonas composti]GEL94590.1 hypothetical protein CCO02nite_12480 [Cellulomonas composti]